MTSSVAFSNYVNRTFYDPEEEVLSTSNYNIEHRFTGVFNYTANWFGEYRTRFLFMVRLAPVSLTARFSAERLARLALWLHSLSGLYRARAGRAWYAECQQR